MGEKADTKETWTIAIFKTTPNTFRSNKCWFTEIIMKSFLTLQLQRITQKIDLI